LPAARIGADGWTSFCVEAEADILSAPLTAPSPLMAAQSAEPPASATSAATSPQEGSSAATTAAGSGGGQAAVATVVDNLDQSATKWFQVISGSWVTHTSAEGANGAYGGSFATTASSAGAETARARFLCSSLTTGQYAVYAWWPAAADNATQVAYDIHQATGVTTVRVDQTVGGGQWNLLGTFTFVGGSCVVDVQNSSSQPGATVCANAVKFVPAGQ
jgi:hypothetical protein